MKYKKYGRYSLIGWLNHIDGPLLHLRNGQLHWLTIKERISLYFGFSDVYKLERKWWNKC
jgi:hypothetical protein